MKAITVKLLPFFSSLRKDMLIFAALLLFLSEYMDG